MTRADKDLSNIFHVRSTHHQNTDVGSVVKDGAVLTKYGGHLVFKNNIRIDI